jgi:hypothetical protein
MSGQQGGTSEDKDLRCRLREDIRAGNTALESDLERWEATLNAQEANLRRRELALQEGTKQLEEQQGLLRRDLRHSISQVKKLAPHIAEWVKQARAEHAFPEGNQLLLLAMQHALLFFSSQGLHLCDTTGPDFLCRRRQASTMDTLAYIGKELGKLWQLPRGPQDSAGTAGNAPQWVEFTLVDGWSSWRRFRNGNQPRLLTPSRQQAVLQLYDEYWGTTSSNFRRFLLRVRSQNQALAENYLGADWTRGTNMPLRPDTLPPHSGGDRRPELATELSTLGPEPRHAVHSGYDSRLAWADRLRAQESPRRLLRPPAPHHNPMHIIQLGYGGYEGWTPISLAVMQEIFWDYGDRLGFADFHDMD